MSDPPTITPSSKTIVLPIKQLETEKAQLQIPLGGVSEHHLQIPLGDVTKHHLQIPLSGSELENDSLEAPFSRLNLKKLSVVLDHTAERLLSGNQLSGLMLIGVGLKAANGAIKSLAEDPVDKQKTGEELLAKISMIAPLGGDEKKNLHWQDPNTGNDYRFESAQIETSKGIKRFLRAFEVYEDPHRSDKEVFFISSLQDHRGEFRAWRVEKNDFSREQLDSLSHAHLPREKSQSLFR